MQLYSTHSGKRYESFSNLQHQQSEQEKLGYLERFGTKKLKRENLAQIVSSEAETTKGNQAAGAEIEET